MRPPWQPTDRPGRRATLTPGTRALAAAVLALIVAAGCTAPPSPPPVPATPRMWGDLPPGPWGVGYRLAPLSDASRPMPDGTPRPMQISVWYPADVDPDDPPMPYRDFVALTAGDRLARAPSLDEGAAAVSGWRGQLVDQAGLAPEAADRWLDAETAARHGSPPAARQGSPRAAPDGSPSAFPIVIFAAGNGNDPYRQTVLCSWLASRGFVVITMPSQSLISGFPTSEADVLPKAEEQAADIAFMAAHARDVSPAPVDVGRQAVIGYSFGGRGLLVDALRRRGAARALVSIDSGLANAQGLGLLQRAPYYDPAHITAPLLHVYQPGDEVVTPDFGIVDAMTASDRLLVRVAGLRHGDFTDTAMVTTLGPGYDALVPADRHPQAGLEITLRWIAAFLDAHLRDDRAGLDALVGRGVSAPVDDVRVIRKTTTVR
ncbi:MAG: hypothetical protein R2752_04965 [Vicinamibacterales bacterium]